MGIPSKSNVAQPPGRKGVNYREKAINDVAWQVSEDHASASLQHVTTQRHAPILKNLPVLYVKLSL
jgi:hypothetical protein